MPGFKPSKPIRRPFQGNNSYSYMPLPSVFQGVQDCRSPNAAAGLQGNNYMPLPSVFQGVQDCRLPGFKPSKPFKPFRRPFQGNNSYSYMPLPSVFHGVQECRLPGFKPSKRRSTPPRQKLLQLHAPAICFSGGSRLPFARLQTLQTLPQAFPRQ